MPFTKGNTLGANGRPAGSLNIATAGKKQLMNYLKEEGADRFLRILEGVDDERFFNKYLDLIEFAFPKQSRIVSESTLNANITTNKLEIDK